LAGYVARRLAQSVLVVLGVLVFVFVLLRTTGDPAALMLPPDHTYEDEVFMRKQLGLDQPLPVQLGRFLLGAAHGDFGTSLRFREQHALPLVVERFPATLELALTALVLALGASLVLGVASAVRRYSWQDNVISVVSLLGQSVPHFWLGLMLVLVFAVDFGLFPTSGRHGVETLVLPALTLATTPLARNTRLIRAAVLEVLGQDYVRTARAKGVRERDVLYRHALRNAAIPIVTIVGLDVGALLGGAVIVETIFGWPGVGKLAIDSIGARDYPVVLADVFFIACSFVLVNLVVDLLYTALDPRIRVGAT
jgi:peptide/nickel transport system permease protein